MYVVEFIVIALVVAEFAGLLSSYTPPTPRLPSWMWTLSLVITYGVELAIMTWAAHNQAVPLWHMAMPLLVVDDRGYAMNNADVVSGSLLLLGAVQSFALLALYRARPERVAVWIGCGALLLLSFAAPVLISFDMYGYVYNDLMGFAAYNPPSTPLPGDFHFIDLWFGHSGPTQYGPLWLALIQVVMGATPTLLGKLLAWRGFCVLLYVAFLFALRANRLPDRIVSVAALNPALMLEYVANGHNDLLPIVIVVYAAAWMRAQPIAGFAGIVIASAMKLPYIALSAPIVAKVRPFWRIVLGLFLVAIAVASVYVIGGGRAYYDSLHWYASAKPSNLVSTVGTLVVLGLLALGTLGKRRLRSAMWVMPLLSSWLFAWYYIWGLPYALGRRRILSYFLVCFPFAIMLFETAFLRLWTIYFMIPVVALASILMPRRRLALPERARRGTFRSRQKRKQKGRA